nr:uncharacterized protein LOC129279705 [Lytechinus pictus]
MRTNREIRIASYSVFIGFLSALILVQLYLSRSDARRKRIEEIHRQQEERFRVLGDYQAVLQEPCQNQQPRACPRCPDTKVLLPESLHKFVDDHMKTQRGSPLVIAKAQSKGIPSYYLSTHPKEKDQETAHLLSGQTGWQDKTLIRLCHLMNNAHEDAFFVDVGAYVGTIAMGVAACGHRVVAIEPHHQNFQLLQESVALNRLAEDRIFLYNIAIGNQTGKTCMAASSSDHSNARIPPSDQKSPLYCKNGEISISRLDDVTKELPVWILHIDVRGYEPAVIAGAEKLLSRDSPPKYLMFSVQRQYSTNALGNTLDFSDILDWLIKIGYKLKTAKHESIKVGKEYLAQLGYDTDYVTAVFEPET